MKRKITIISMLLIMLVSIITGCSNNIQPSSIEHKPDIAQIRSICELATLKCYYHNVAKSTKKAGSGIFHLGEKDREFWIEYDGTVNLGIDMTAVKLSINGNDVTISIPPAKILSVTIDEASYNKDSYIESSDGFNKNKITSEDTTEAVKNATEEMKQTAQSNTALLISAQNRAKELIENYIIQIGTLTETTYNITWDYID